MIDRSYRLSLIAQRAPIIAAIPRPRRKRPGPKHTTTGSTFGANEGTIEDAIDDLGVSIKERG